MRILMLVVLICYPFSVFAQQCADAYEPAVSQLRKVEDWLRQAATKADYQKSVEQRYDAIELLVFVANACSTSQNISEKERNQWKVVKDVMEALQSSAKSSAFTKFSDWISAKNADLTQCLRVTQVAAVSVTPVSNSR